MSKEKRSELWQFGNSNLSRQKKSTGINANYFIDY